MKIVAITPDGKMDAVCSVIIEGMNDAGVNVIASDPGNSVIRHYSEQEVVQHGKDADYIFAFFGKVRGNRPPKYNLLSAINRPDVTAYIDGSEWTATGYPDGDKMITSPWGVANSQVYEAKFDSRRCKGTPWIHDQMYAYCRWYFKRECYPEDEAMGLIPLNVGCQNKFFGGYDLEKDIDVFCSFGHFNNGYRYEIARLCERLKTEGYKVLIAKGLEYQEYLQSINRSYVSVSSWGAGNSCMRLYENMANASCCFAQRTEIAFIDKPDDGIHYVEYSSMKEFETKIRDYLQDKERCIDIGKRGLSFVSNKHTGKARFNYILEQILKNT
jgi:hypothetical protein